MTRELITNVLDLLSFLLVLPDLINDRTMGAIKKVADTALQKNYNLFENRLRVRYVVAFWVPTNQPYFTIWFTLFSVSSFGFIASLFSDFKPITTVMFYLFCIAVYSFSLVPGLVKLLFLVIRSAATKRTMLIFGVLLFGISRTIAIVSALRAVAPAIP